MLGSPGYVNFIPESGVFAVHAQKDLLITIDNEEVMWGETARQRSPHIKLPNSKDLCQANRETLSGVVLELWRYCGKEVPGGGIVLLCDRMMYRRLVFNEPPPGPVARFFDWFLERYEGS